MMIARQVLVASPPERSEVARAIQSQLQDVGLVRVWNEGVFGVSPTTIESLSHAIHTSDFAVVILRGEDFVTIHGSTTLSPRDNVLFEIGLFMAYLGHDRVFVVHDVHQPIGLGGVASAEFDGSTTTDLIGALGPACLLIRQAILRVNKEAMPAET